MQHEARNLYGLRNLLDYILPLVSYHDSRLHRAEYVRLHVISVRFYIQNNVCLFDLGRKPAQRTFLKKNLVSYHKSEKKKPGCYPKDDQCCQNQKFFQGLKQTSLKGSRLNGSIDFIVSVKKSKQTYLLKRQCPNVSTTHLPHWGFQQCSFQLDNTKR